MNLKGWKEIMYMNLKGGKEIMCRRISLLLISLVLIFSLAIVFNFTGCATREEIEKKEVVISIFVPDAGNPYYQNKVFGYYLGKELLKVEYPDYEVNFELFNAGGYDKPMKQIAQVEDAITRDVDAIILTVCDADALVEVTKKALNADIPVIADDVLVNTETNMRISEYSYRVGVNSGAFIAKELDGKGNVVLLKGPSAASLFIDRGQGITDELDRYPDIHIIAEQYHTNDIMEGRRIMEDWILAYGDEIDAVWATNAMVTCGAAEALKDAGFNQDDVLVVGIDFSDIAFEYMDNGWMDALLPAQPIKIARVALMNAFYAAIGREIPKIIYSTDDIMIRRDEMETFDKSDALAPKDWKPEWRS